MSWFKWRKKPPCVGPTALEAREEAEQGTAEAEALLREVRGTVPWLREIRENNHFAESVRLSLGGNNAD